jgi:small subunit ribosomal protein S11
MADEEKEEKSQAPAAEPTAAAAGSAVQPGEGSPVAPESAEGGEKADSRRHRTRGLRAIPAGLAHIRASFNNTQVSVTDRSGAVIAWSSAGRAGFKGSRKSTAYAATLVAQEVGRQAVARGMREVEVMVQGAGAGRESAIRALQAAGLTVTVIKDVTPIPHNGCRARKRRRV